METEYICSLRLRAKGADKAFFGLGPYRLMEEIQKTQSLRLAAMKMGMAYSKAWSIIRHAQKEMGVELVNSTTGGAGGGSTTLTHAGEELIEAYKNAMDEINANVRLVSQKHFGKLF